MSDIVAATPSATGLSAPNWGGHGAKFSAVLRRAAISAMPLTVVLVVLLSAWQIAADHPTASLPAPTKIWADSAELIIHPFYDRGGLDKGLGLHLFASLQRVALGFVLSALAGVALGLLVGTSEVAMRGLDPIFQVLRTVPPLAWLPLSLAAPFRGPTAGTSTTFPLALLTGRLRDQWHTMTRTGNVPRLMAHAPEPEISVHPADTALPQGSLVRIASADGTAVLRLRHDSGLARGTAFAPMHWTDAFCPSARVNAVVGDAADPISGQPELKATPISIARAQFAWHGFALLRGRLPTDIAAWCAAVPEPGGLWRHVLAGYGRPAAALAILVAATRLDGVWSRLDDAAAGTHRAVRVLDGRISACVFIAASEILPPVAWLVAAFPQPAPPALALLAGGPAGGSQPSPTICICHGIDAGAITRAISAGCTSVTAIGQTTGAGTGCGSCRPEINALLRCSVAIEDTVI